MVVKRRVDQTPWWNLVPRFLRAILSVSGVIQLIALAAFMYVASFIPLAGGIIAGGAYAVCYLLIVRHAFRGGVDMPEPGAEDFPGLMNTFLRFAVAWSYVWIPTAVYAITGERPDVMSDPLLARHDPVMLALILFGALYTPAALLVTAVTDDFLALLNPFTGLQVILRLPGQYVATFGAWLLCFLVNWVLAAPLAGLLMELPIPILPSILARALLLVLPFLSAFLLGRLVWQNAHLFRLLTEQDLWEPQVLHPYPTGKQMLEPTRAAEPPPMTVDPALIASIKPRGSSEYRAPNSTAALDLATALRFGDSEAALVAFALPSGPKVAGDLEPALQLQLVDVLEAADDAATAAQLCQHIARKVPGSLEAAHAVLRYAKLLTFSLGQPAQAVPLLEQLVARHGADGVGVEARGLLATAEQRKV